MAVSFLKRFIFDPFDMITKVLVRLLLAIALMPAVYAQADVTHPSYDIVDPRPLAPHATVPMVEFFSYSCVHCNEFEGALNSWSEARKNAVRLERVPVNFGKESIPLQRLYYTLEELGLISQLHGKIFTELHTRRRALNTDEIVIAFVVENGVDRAQFMRAYTSQVVERKIRRADLLTRQYKVQHIPALVAAGKYRTSPSMFFKRNQSGLDFVLAFFKFDNSNADKRRKAMGDTLNTADMLIAKVVAEGRQ